MGGEWRCWFQLASPEELKERAARLKKVPKTKHGYHYPHEAFLGEYKESDDVILMLPHDKETEVKYVDPFGEEEGEKTLSVRHVMEKKEGLEKYGESVESGVKDMVDFLEACGTPIPSKLTTVKFTQNQRITKVKCSDKDKKKVKLEYSKMTVLVKKEAHGRGTAGALEEKWITVAARGPPTLVKSMVEELTTNCKALAAESVKTTTAAEEEQEGGSSSSSAAAASSDFPTFIEGGFAEFVSLMAARVKPPPIPMTKRAKTEGGADDVDGEDGEKKSKKQKKKDAAAAGEAAMAGLAAGLAVVEGAGAAVAAAAAAAAAKGKGPVADKAKESDDDDDQDDEPILKMLPAKKKPGPKSKKEKEEMAAAAAAEAAANGGAALPAPAAAAETPKKERKKPGPKSKKEKEEIAAKAAAEAAAKAAAKAAAAEKEDSDSSGTDSDSDDDKPLAAML